MTHVPTDLAPRFIARTIGVACLTAAVALTSPAGTAGQATIEELSARATDPMASLMAFHLIGDVRASYHGSDASGFVFKVQPVIPFEAFGHSNLMRIIVPYQSKGPGSEGLKNVSLFDLVLFDQEWGRLGVGPVMMFSEGITDDAAQFSIGPAVGAVWDYSPGLQLGLFNQNLIGDDLAITQFQPIASYQLGNGWALSTGDLQFVYDWDRGDWLNVPLGVELGRVYSIAGQPMRFSVGPQWNLRSRSGTPQSRINLSAVLLAPNG